MHKRAKTRLLGWENAIDQKAEIAESEALVICTLVKAMNGALMK